MSQSTAAVPAPAFGWFGRFLTSSIGKKLVMSLTGLFLVSFLVVHLIGNLKLLIPDGGYKFNEYAYFMTHFPVIKAISYLLYFSILLHAIQGWIIWRQNRVARGNNKYAVKVNRVASTNGFAASNMASLGTIIFIFIALHMWQFWLQMKLGVFPANVEANYLGKEIMAKDLYTPVKAAFSNPVYVVIYVISMLAVAFHLNHGFASSFQTLGINHEKYNGLIRITGQLVSILLPLGFAIIPIVMFGQSQGWW